MARDIDLLETAAKGLAYTKRPGFGSHSLLAPNGVMFAAVAGVGRLAVKVPDEAMAATLRARGAAPWEYSRTMEDWLLLPRDMLSEPEQLREWVRRAHALALHTPEKAKAAIAAEDSALAAPAEKAQAPAPAKKARKAPAKRGPVAPETPAPALAPPPEPAPSASPSPRPGPAERAKRAKASKAAAPKKAAKRTAGPAAPAKKAGAKKAAAKKARGK